MYIYVQIYINMDMHTYIYIYIYIHVYIYICIISIFIYICICIHMIIHVYNIYIYIYIYIHMYSPGHRPGAAGGSATQPVGMSERGEGRPPYHAVWQIWMRQATHNCLQLGLLSSHSSLIFAVLWLKPLDLPSSPPPQHLCSMFPDQNVCPSYVPLLICDMCSL